MSAYFVTATGTDIGKTFVTAGLVRYWRAAGRTIGALKPVASGFDIATAPSSDPGVLLAALGKLANPSEIERIAPWRFAEPLSPDMAARREGRSIDFGELLQFCRTAINEVRGTLLIEGVGGVMVPLDGRHTVLDWMAELGLPVIIVTGSYLGSISHTLTALDALASRRLTARALVVNETPASTVPVADTIKTLTNFVRSVPIVGLNRIAGRPDSNAFAEIAALL
jgi:dethiobiotin synthetase